ncbi:MAG: PAS domain S-box protein [Candidatus Aminicenantes bacterium]|nr:PAS domain S-box protein [Candidatus Aminicenantes bacterium]
MAKAKFQLAEKANSAAPPGHFSITIISKENLKIEWGSDVFQKFFGYVPTSLPPQIPPTLDLPSRRRFKTWWNQLLQGKPVTHEFCLHNKKGKERWIRACGYPYWEESQKRTIRITGFIQDITKEKYLQENLNHYQRIINEAVEGFFQSTPDGRFLRANLAMARILGYNSPHDLISSPQPLAKASYVNPEQREEYLKLMQEKGEVKGFIFPIRRPDGKIVWLLENARAVRNKKGQILYFEGHVQDVTQLKETEKALMESQARLESLIDAAPDLIYFKDNEGKYLIANRAFEKTFNRKKEDLIGRNDEEILPADLALQCRQSDEEIFTTKKIVIREETMQTKDGQMVIFETIKSPVLAADGSIAGLVGISRNITTRKKTEAELRSLLQEKEILLREIHHRVKNNMQVISSLLNLQAQKLEDPKARQALKECQERIRSMSLVHDKLYQQENFHKIEFSSYLRSLATHLFHAYQIDASQIKLHFEVEEVILNLNTAIPCGLIINELVTNALKHAFSPEQKGEIIITLKQRQAGEYLLGVKDNGRGLPLEINLDQPRTLGLEIVTILVDQIEGHLEVKVNGGTEFLITFKEQSVFQEQ